MSNAVHDPIALMVRAKAVLAPMAGITDVPFRLLCRKFGCAFAFTEMIDVNGIKYRNRKTLELMNRVPGDSPLGVQLVGREEEDFVRAAEVALERGFDVLDVNAACPARKVVSPGKGAALMKEPKRLAGIIRALTKAVKIPVTVKIRAGWDDKNLNYLEVAKAAEDAGAAAVTIHSRTKAAMYKGKAEHNYAREIKESVKIPVFASGNIFSARDAAIVISETGADGVFVARGALGHPWIFGQINSLFFGEEAPKIYSVNDVKKVLMEHYALSCKFCPPDRQAGGEVRTKSRMYKHVMWYLKGCKNLHEAMASGYKKVKNVKDFEEFLREV